MSQHESAPLVGIQGLIYLIRGQKVMLDKDLAARVARGFQDNEEELQAVRFALDRLMNPPQAGSKRPIGFRKRG